MDDIDRKWTYYLRGGTFSRVVHQVPPQTKVEGYHVVESVSGVPTATNVSPLRGVIAPRSNYELHLLWKKLTLYLPYM